MTALAIAQPTTVAPDAVIVAVLVAKGKADRPHLSSRLDKAAALVANGAVEYDEFVDGYWVRGSNNPEYLVRVRDGKYLCTCPDHEYREFWCKHNLSAALVRRAAEEAATAPTPLASCTRCQTPVQVGRVVCTACAKSDLGF